MKLRNRIFIIIAIVSMSAFIVTVYIVSKDNADYSIVRTIKYQYQIQNKTNKFIKQSEFWAYAPVPKTSNQIVKNIQSSQPFDSEYDELGNHIQTFIINDLAPFATKIITLTVTLNMSEKANRLQLSNKDKYLNSEKNIESDNDEMISFSQNLIKQVNSDKAEVIFNWVSKNIQYEGYIKDDRGALYALKKRSGDCTEYSYLFTALSRVQNIPTRVIGGYLYNEDKLLKPEDFHNWAESYKNDRWYIADTQNSIFNKKVQSYIAFRIVSGINNHKLGNSHRFAYSNSDLIVKLK